MRLTTQAEEDARDGNTRDARAAAGKRVAWAIPAALEDAKSAGGNPAHVYLSQAEYAALKGVVGNHMSGYCGLRIHVESGEDPDYQDVDWGSVCREEK